MLTAVTNVETWNGSSWTETTDLNSARNLGGVWWNINFYINFWWLFAGGGAPG